MANRPFDRTVSTTAVHLAEFKDGALHELESLLLNGAISDNKRIMNEVRKVYGKTANIVVTGTEISEEKRRISFEDFMKYSYPAPVKSADENVLSYNDAEEM